jgi:hypothetical protein
MKRTLVIACLVLGIAGCWDDRNPPIDGGSGNGGGNHKDAGPSDEKDASVAVDAGPVDGPDLKFTMPEASSDPNDDTVVATRMVTVRCQATSRADGFQLDESSIAITLEKEGPGPSERIASPIDALGNGEYEAKFDVSERANGTLRFHCTAKDLATNPNYSEAILETLLDLGPRIEVLEPKDKGIYALRTPVAIQLQVTPEPLGTDDREAAVTDVKLMVSGMELPLVEAEDKPGYYQTSIDFGDYELFMVPPTSAEVLVTATNSRTPDAVTRLVKYDVNIDREGPAIAVQSPPDGALVHGEVTLKFTVDDVSGVKAGSVQAELNGNVVTISDFVVMGNSYSATFDTRVFGTEVSGLTILLSATDVVGNQSAVLRLLRLDSLPPVISLDPPMIREWHQDGAHYYCSEAFDPVGADSQNDLTTASVASIYRAVVMDQTNRAPGESFSPLAGVAESKVVLYAQRDSTVPLLIDTNGDEICDDINYDAVAQSQRPVSTRLAAMPPRGESWYSKTVNFHEVGSDLSSNTICAANPSGGDSPPAGICGAPFPPPLTRIIAGQSESRPPAVFSLNPTNAAMGIDCAGGAWELVPIVGEGWRCLAVRAEDTIGNIGVSAPLRICFDNGIGTPQCNAASDTPPSCTDGCTISPAQLYAPNQVWHE